MSIAAASQFTHGLPVFFIAIAVLAWFVAWWAFAATAVVNVFKLANRQFNSRARFVAQGAMARLQGKD
ncbi:MAG: DUF599 family protein [Hyphomonadaceae bacterium]